MRNAVIGTGFAVLGATRLHRLAPAELRGLGAILMLHRVRPPSSDAFRPNGLLEIAPAFLDALLTRVRAIGYDIVTMGELVERLKTAPHRPGRPFLALTFDDGYRDNREHALPILERHDAPFTLYVTPGFADRTARLWWMELEEAIRRVTRVDLHLADGGLTLPARCAAEKRAAWSALYGRLRAGDEAQLQDATRQLCVAAGIDRAALVAEACMGWEGIAEIARHPLATIGAHTMTHPRLAKLGEAEMTQEIVESRRIIETRIGRPVAHFAYPVGDPTSATQREFETVRRLGFASGVTTRPGLLFPEHGVHLAALPRLSVNGNWQNVTNIEVLLSGLAFALWNRGRRVNAA